MVVIYSNVLYWSLEIILLNALSVIKPVEVTTLFKYLSPKYLALVTILYLPRPGFNRFDSLKNSVLAQYLVALSSSSYFVLYNWRMQLHSAPPCRFFSKPIFWGKRQIYSQLQQFWTFMLGKPNWKALHLGNNSYFQHLKSVEARSDDSDKSMR